MMNEFEAISKKTMQDLDTRERGLINFFFLRALELMLLTLVLCSLLAWACTAALCPCASFSVSNGRSPAANGSCANEHPSEAKALGILRLLRLD